MPVTTCGLSDGLLDYKNNLSISKFGAYIDTVNINGQINTFQS